MNTLSTLLSSGIELRVQAILDAHKAGKPLPEPVDFFTDNVGEVIEKLIVLHIRVWFFENEFHDHYNDDAKLAATKKKMDILWKIKKPALTAALNRMIDDALIHGRSLREESLKNYNGFKEESK